MLTIESILYSIQTKMATGQYNFDTTTKPIFFELSSTGQNTTSTNTSKQKDPNGLSANDCDFTVTIPGNAVTLTSSQVPILSLIEYSIPNTFNTFKANMNDTLIFKIDSADYRFTFGDSSTHTSYMTTDNLFDEIHQQYNIQKLVTLLNNWCRGNPTGSPANMDVSLTFSASGNCISLTHTASGSVMRYGFYGSQNLPSAFSAYANRLANQQFGIDPTVGCFFTFPSNAQQGNGQNWTMQFNFPPMLSYDDCYCIQVVEPKCTNNRKSNFNSENSTLALIPIQTDKATTSGTLQNSSVLVSDTTKIAQFQIRITGERSNQLFDFSNNPVTLRFRLDAMYKQEISTQNPQNQLGPQNILRDSTGYAEATYLLPNLPNVPPPSKRGRLF